MSTEPDETSSRSGTGNVIGAERPMSLGYQAVRTVAEVSLGGTL
jgi:hypothetical protein